MPLGTELGLCPGDIVLDGDPGSPEKGGTAAPFSVYLLWLNGCPSQLLLSSCFYDIDDHDDISGDINLWCQTVHGSVLG